MNPYILDVLRLVKSVLALIGGSTIVALVVWLFRRRQETFENKLLDLFYKKSKLPARTVDGVHADYMGQFLKDVPMWVVFPTHTSMWGGIKWRLRTAPYQLRHLWRMNFLLPSKSKVNRTVMHLWRSGLLIRDPIDPNYFKLKS